MLLCLNAALFCYCHCRNTESCCREWAELHLTKCAEPPSLQSVMSLRTTLVESLCVSFHEINDINETKNLASHISLNVRSCAGECSWDSIEPTSAESTAEENISNTLLQIGKCNIFLRAVSKAQLVWDKVALYILPAIKSHSLRKTHQHTVKLSSPQR